MRIATFNVLHGRSPADDVVDLDRFREAIRTIDADILALQEVDRDQTRSHGADLTALAAEAMGATAHRFVPAMSGLSGEAWRPTTGQEQPGTPAYGGALLSRFPVRDWQVLSLPPFPVPVPVWRGRTLRPDLVRDEARTAVMATVDTPVGDLVVGATHVSFLPGSNVRQLRRVVKALTARPGRAVLMGDLNMGPSFARRVTGLDSLAEAPTFPSAVPRRQIDHILGREMPATGKAEAVQLPLSDHLALVLELPDPAW